MEQQFFYLGEW